ncbi:hypothetical protein [Microbulbifer sp. TYP-18]|uniref:hypothetical protein n=1 Tax=Microbulbifer sp. TYP-18 TaxID=3230024 RepID=UPI0034C6C120
MWNIFIEQELSDNDPAMAGNAKAKLEKNLNKIFSVLPEQAASKLRALNIYLLWGEQSTNGGRSSGMSYFREGEPQRYDYLDPLWNNVIVIYSAKNLMYLDKLWAQKALMHELAHAWHINNWPEKYKPIYSAYQQAKQQGLYRNIKNNRAGVVPDAYALKNALEYFAELSAMHFVGGNYFPFNAKGLREYDPTGANVIASLWF